MKMKNLLFFHTALAVSEDEDDQPLVQRASRKEPVEEKRESAAEHRVPTQERRRKGPPPIYHTGARCVTKVAKVSILGRNPHGEALRIIISKLSNERNLMDIHPKHYHMSTAQFKKRTTHLDSPGKVTFTSHVVRTCPFCNSTKPRPDRSRVSGLRAEEFADLIFPDYGSTKFGDKTFAFPIVWKKRHHI